MGSESEQVIVDDSDDSILDFKELDDNEFDIPTTTPPSLESVLWDSEDGGSDSASMHSFQSWTSKSRSMLYHCILQGISAQISSAGERVCAGLPTVISNSIKYVAIGMSHGYVLSFNSEQNLCWCCYDPNDQGAISALAFNLDSTRLLVGYERGLIVMIDTGNGDIIRRLTDAHAPQTAVLHLRFTFMNNLALCGDSSGCVFSLSFNKRLGLRTWDSKCLFSGARGEVCVFEPLIKGQDFNFLNNNVLIAMATLSKVIVISIKPRLKVLFSQQLPRVSTSLPLICWQLVSVGKTFQPVLAWGRCYDLNYTRVVYNNSNKIRLIPLRSVKLPYQLTAIHWLGTRHLALLDTSENLRLIQVRTQKELEVLELATAGLVYSSAHFKALAVGGGVSEAFALAGERACYNSLSSRGDQLLVLGTKAVHLIKLRTWPERLLYLSEQDRWTEAFNLIINEGFNNKEKFTLILLNKFLENINQNVIDKDSLTAAINCCIKLNKTDILCNELWEAVSSNSKNLDWYYNLLTDNIINGQLVTLTPTLSQILINYLNNGDVQILENVLLSLDVYCLDLHQVLNICKNKKIYNGWIHIITKTIGDYTSPLIEFLLELTPDNSRLGNTMLVYVSSCLAGLAYPCGNIPDEDVARVKYDIIRCLETIHSINANENEPQYPYLRSLLKYNTRDCLNVIELAFTEAEFSGEIGLLQRQRLIHILIQVVKPTEFSDSQIINLACFISRLITSNNLNLENNIFNKIVYYLTTIKSDNLSSRDHNEREQAWIELLQLNKLDDYCTNDNLLKLSLESNCYLVVEYLYEQQKNYSNILSCYLKDPIRKSDVFNYITIHINNLNRCIQQQFFYYFKELITINSKQTGDIVCEYYSESIDKLTNLLDNEPQYQYEFLQSLIINDTKLSPQLAEKYLQLLCELNKNSVSNYLKITHLCRIDKALEITKKYNIHNATAILLEQNGEWIEALNLLLKYLLIDEAIHLCIRGSEHLDNDEAQKLWLILLKNKNNFHNISLRQLLHAAAPHVPPAQLINLISDVNFGDVKILLTDILNDQKHDINMLTTTLNMLDKDLHHGLVKSLAMNGKGVAINNLNCYLCQKTLIGDEQKQSIAVWGCGHCFHQICLNLNGNETICPQCRTKATQLPTIKLSKYFISNKTSNSRVDLEGHF